MLLIAVTGPVGAGKTTRLAELAAGAEGEGRAVEGFLALAEGRAEVHTEAEASGGRGAEAYRLRWLASGEETPFARRDEAARAETGVPYRFEAEAFAQTRAWAQALPQGSGLIILDEFGKAEAGGGGHLALWPHVEASSPAVVVIAVREGCVDRVAARLGRPFDAVVEASDPEAPRRLRALCAEHDDWARVGLFGAGAGGIEVTVGSALHAARVPLRGLALSSTQAVVLAHAAAGLAHRPRVVWVAFVAAGLKALSPAGGRLRPMLAIAVQGVLFSLALRILGWNAAARFVGGALVGAWAALQGVALQWLLVGEDLLRAYDAIVSLAAARGLGVPGLAVLLAAWGAAWALVAGGLTAALFGRRGVGARIERALGKGATVPAEASSRREVWRGALADLARPSFWLPVALVALFVVLGGSPWERALWIGLRAATVGVVVFALARTFRPEKAAAWLRRRGQWGPAEALARALGKG